MSIFIHPDQSPVLTEDEELFMQKVREAEEPIDDPTTTLALFQTVERLVKEIERMREHNEEIAQTIKYLLSLRQSIAAIEHERSALEAIAGDLLSFCDDK